MLSNECQSCNIKEGIAKLALTSQAASVQSTSASYATSWLTLVSAMEETSNDKQPSSRQPSVSGQTVHRAVMELPCWRMPSSFILTTLPDLAPLKTPDFRLALLTLHLPESLSRFA